MKRAPNKQVGTTPCPMRNCEKVAAVFRYREYSADTTRRRFAGKLYCHCETHGRLDADEFIRENGKLWGPNDAPADASATGQPHASSPAPAPVKTATPAPAKTQVQSTSKPPAAPVQTQARKAGDFFL